MKKLKTIISLILFIMFSISSYSQGGGGTVTTTTSSSGVSNIPVDVVATGGGNSDGGDVIGTGGGVVIVNPPTNTTTDNFVAFSESYAKGVQYMQGKGVLEEWFTDGFLPLYDQYMRDEYTSMTTLASIIGGIMALLYLSFLGWEFMSGAKPWSILPILRPFAIGLVIMNWNPFVTMLKAPFVQMQKAQFEDYQSSQLELNALRVERFALMQRTLDVVYEMGAEYETMEESQKQNQSYIGGLWDDAYNSLISPITNITARLSSSINFAISGLLETLGLWILRIAVYAMFFIQLLTQTIMIILGPLAFGFSILPAFSQSYISWIQKFINVSLYGFICFIVLKLGSMLQIFAMNAEIERFLEMVPTDPTATINRALIVSYASQGISSFGMVIVAFVMTAIGIALVPKLADYVIGSGGANSSLIRGAGSAANVATGGKLAIALKALKKK